jgi:hypothetical protein
MTNQEGTTMGCSAPVFRDILRVFEHYYPDGARAGWFPVARQMVELAKLGLGQEACIEHSVENVPGLETAARKTQTTKEE